MPKGQRHKRYNPATVARREYAFWITLLSALVSAAPIVSLIQRLFKVGLAPLLFEALSYYRKLVYPLVEWLQFILSYVPWLDPYTLIYSWFVPLDVYKDLTALSFMSAIAASRVIIHKVVFDKKTRASGLKLFFVGVALILTLTTLVAFFFAFTLLALVFPFVAIVNWIRYRHLDPEFYTTYLISLTIALVAAGAFYVTNELIK